MRPLRATLATTAAAALVLAGLSASTAPSYADPPGVTATSTVSASANASSSDFQVDSSVHTGSYDGWVLADAMGPASATAGQSVAADTEALTASGSVTAHADAEKSGMFVSAFSESALDLTWTPARSGCWRLTATVAGAGPASASITLTPAGGAAVLELKGTARGWPATSDQVVDFTAGQPVHLTATAIANALTETDTEPVDSSSQWSVALVPWQVPSVVDPPRALGTKRVGNKLTATTGSWAGDPASYSYRWLRSGKAIPQATHRTYRLTKADQGKRIAVRVTANKPPGPATTATSKGYLVRKRRS